MIIDFSKYKLEILLFILFFYSLIFCNLSKSRVLFIESNDEALSYFHWKRPEWVKWWYWELNWNMQDSSWNWHNWSWTANYSTWHKTWIQSYYAQNSNYKVSIPNSSELYMWSWESFSFWFRIKPTYWKWTAWTYWVISMTQNVDSYAWRSIHNDSTSRDWQIRIHANWQSQVWGSLSDLNFNANERFHFVITYDWTTLKYYKNAELVWSMTLSIWDCSQTQPLLIWYANTWNATWSAYYDNVFFMKNYCLSQNEISKMYSE